MAGFFDEPKAPTPMSTPYFSVTCETEGVNYKYSLDDSEPSQVSVDLNESGHFQLISGSPTTIRIRAYKEGYEPSDIATKTYTPVTVPMALPDGSVLFYDRGMSYGEYCIGDDGYPARLSSGEDDGSVESTNWRYLICDSTELSEKRQWGASSTDEGITGTNIGYGLPNTEIMLAKYSKNTTYIWQLVQNKRNDTDGKKWFVPCKDELNLVYQNKDIIVNAGGSDFPTDAYQYSSSEYNMNGAWSQGFYDNGNWNNLFKNAPLHCRLLRRI